MITTVAIVGGGNMGGAIARALTQSTLVKKVKVSDINENTLRSLQNFNNHIEVSTSNADIVKGADLVILAVKPWLVETVIDTFKAELDYSKQLFLSIAACVSFERLSQALASNGKLPALFRMIPNTGIDVLQSVSSIAAYSNTTTEQQNELIQIFSELGKAFLVPESQINAMMALSSCGIAYAFRYIRAAVEGGVELGLYPETAKQVVMQTLRGAVDLLETNDSHPEMEIDKVTTPGGTTIRGLNAMEANGFTTAVIEGLKASFIK